MNDKTILKTFLLAFGLTILIASIYLASNGLQDSTIRMMLRASAQASFTVLILILIARPLFQLHKNTASKWLMRNRTLLGVTFAGIHIAHLSLILLRAYEIQTFHLVLSENILGVIAYLMIIAMLITSFKKPRQMMGAKSWKVLHKFGLYTITLAFVLIIAPSSLDKISDFNPSIAVLLITAFTLRVMAFIKSK